MPFFIRNKLKTSANPKRKAGAVKENAKSAGKAPNAKKKKKSDVGHGEEIASDSDEEVERHVSSSDEDVETAQEKRIRLAKEYLSQLKDNDDNEDNEVANDAISHRLREDLLEKGGRLQKEIASTLVQPTADDIRTLRGHKLSVCCLVVTTDKRFIFSASKDCSIIKWSVLDGKRLKVIAGCKKDNTDSTGHTSHVLCLAITSDSKFLASGDRSRLIFIWNPDTCQQLHMFRGHRDAISGLAFRKGTHQLFSGSHDRTVKIWNVDEMAYVETLYGHLDAVTGVDSLSRERAVTSGGRDHSLRIWKVIEESQLVFHGHIGSIDCVSLINEEHFVSGADDSSLALWSVLKKKPLVTVHNSHTEDAMGGGGENWLTAVTSLKHTDLIASGSKNGYVRLWKCSKEFRALTPLYDIPVVGFVNALEFSSDGSFLVVGTGQEHRLGRWWRIKEARNSVMIITLPRETQPS